MISKKMNIGFISSDLSIFLKKSGIKDKRRFTDDKNKCNIVFAICGGTENNR